MSISVQTVKNPMTKVSKILSLVALIAAFDTVSTRAVAQEAGEIAVRREEKAIVLRKTLEAAATAAKQGDLTSAAKAYEDALAIFRKGDFAVASTAFNDFIKRHPKSGYVLPSLFWLGNAQYASRSYVSAINNFNTLILKAPTHLRAPDSMLSVANCQLELKDIKAARKTLGEVVKTYPHTEAAAAASERLAKLK